MFDVLNQNANFVVKSKLMQSVTLIILLCMNLRFTAA